MTPRDWFETSWHAGLLVLVATPVLRFLQRALWARLLLALIVVAALAYHVAVVQACDARAPLCYWR